jgi:hypothetical protein
MIARVRFIDEGMQIIADSCKGVFTLTHSENRNLTLWVDGTRSFLIHYSEDLASGIGQPVEYRNGMILFTDRVTSTEECPVCFETYEPMYRSTCGHNCCIDCMRKMGERGLTRCPLCRSAEFRYPVAIACNQIFV